MKITNLAETAPPVPAPTYTLLLVDDNPTNLSVLFEILNDSEFRLLFAEDGEAALEQVQYVKPDIILLDVMMPRLDGFETCQRLKADPDTRDIPVIFMTALHETVNKVKGLSIGGVDYITKPIQVDEVLARVRVHLELYRLQKQLQAQNQQLQTEVEERQQAERSLQLMVKAVSHDLRNPVTGMLMVLHNLLGKAELGKADAKTAPENDSDLPGDTVTIARSILERMADSSQRQLNLINSLLHVHADSDASSVDMASPGSLLAPESAPEAAPESTPESTPSSTPPSTSESNSALPTLVLHQQPLYFHALVASVVTDLEPLLDKYQTHIYVQVPETLPKIWGDANQLWRVLENLIINAVKHNAPGIEVAIAAQPQILAVASGADDIAPRPLLQCRITDNGNGIPLEEQSQLFEAYRRGSAHQRSPGIGLGLYLCRQIIEAHGGTIELESALGQGATFEFTLPIA
ncbi:MAG: hybrid sensor histidine kinase/response regulator [Elainellaceae cyanobacterium]